MLLAASIGLLQAQTSPDYIFGSDNGAGWNWTTGTQGTASLGNSYKWQFAATATDNHYFKFGETASNADGSGFWVNSSGPDMNYTGGGAKWTAYYKSNMGDGGAIYTAITSGNYYVVKARKQAGNDIDFAVFDNGAAAPVTVSSVTRTISGNDLTVTATASAAASTNEKIWLRYSKDNWVTSTTTEMTFTSGTSYAATLNCTSGDFVSYYVLTTINQTSAPAEVDVDFYTVNYNNNGGKNYTVQIGPFSGNYYIPQGTNAKGFSSLANAFANINEVGISGTVYLYIDDNLSETGANLVLNRTDLTATNNLVIKPAPTKTPTITISGCTSTAGASQYSGIALDDADYITFDGSNTVGGTTQDLTIKLNETSTTYGRVIIQLYGNTDNNVIKNVKLLYQVAPGSTSASYAIYINGQTTNVADNLLIQNCQIGDATYYGAYAINVKGTSTAYATNINVRNNICYGTIRKIHFNYVGTSGTTSEISGNTIYGYAPPSGNVSWGILLNTYNGTINVFNNKINTLIQSSSGTEGLYGIGTLSGQSSVHLNIYNNMVGGDFQHTGTGTPASIDVISLQDNCPDANIYHNTVVLNNMTKTASTRMTGIRWGGSANVELKNNIVICDKDASVVYALNHSGGTLSSDYNDIYVSGADANVGYYSSARKTLSDWQTASGEDAHSKSKDVNFVSATDLSLTGTSIDDLDLAAPAIDGVTTDIFGNARHTPNVYMGAHEPNNLNDTQTFTVTVPNGTQHVYIAGSFIGKSWDITTPYELTAKANPNEFIGTFPAHSNVEYKYLCEKGDWDYQEAVYQGSGDPIQHGNRTYNANDVVDIWYRVKSVTLNVSFEPTVGVPNQLFILSSINNWASAFELTKSGATFTRTLTNDAQKVPANTEYKYYTNEPTEQNWECNLDMTASANRKTIAPVMNDTIQRFTTRLVTETEVPALAPRLMRTTTGIRVELTEPANIELYNINGSLIEKTKATGTYTRDLNNGIYIIRINGKSTKFVK